MELSRLAIALWVWVVISVAAGIALIVMSLGSTFGIVGVVLIIIGLVSILVAIQSTIGDLTFDLAE